MSDATDTAAPRQPDPGNGSIPARVRDAWGKVLRNPSAMIIASTGLQSAMRLVSNIILARLLAPSAFALIAITSLILTGLQMVSDVGIAVTALREGEMSKSDEAKLWTMQFVRGFGVGFLMIAAAVPVGWIYQDWRLTEVLLALSVMPVLQGAQSLYPILALAHRRLLPSTLLEVGGRTVSIVASILVALVTPTVWSLVIATLMGSFFTAIGSHMLVGHLPRFVFDRDYIGRQWKFSRWIQTSSTLTFVGTQIDKALFPFLFGMTALGVYGIGATFAAIPAQITQRWSSSVFYPLTVQLLKGGEQARAQLFHVRHTMLMYTVVVTLSMMAMSPSFFFLLYQPQYHAAARFAQILAIGTYFEVSESSLRHLPLVEGTPHYEVWTVVVRMIAFIGAAIAFKMMDAGIIGYAISYVVGLASSYTFMLIVDIRRGYLRPGFDVVMTTGLVGATVCIYFLPLFQTSRLGLVVQGVVVAVAGGAALLAIYARRGLPSLPAEPAPAVLREAIDEEIDGFPKPI